MISPASPAPVRLRPLALLAALGLVVALTPVPHASAQTMFTVTSAADEPDDTPGDGACATDAGDCTLRAAVQEANALGDDVSVSLPADTYVLDSGDGQLDVTDTTNSLSIQGDGADTTIIDGNATTRIFDVAADAELSIGGVTLRNATASSDGGAVYNAGSFSATGTTFRDNEVTGGNDGGVLENDGTMSVDGSTFVANDADDESGAIDNDTGSTLTITGSVFEDNTAAGGAGAVENEGALTITESIFRNNTVTGGADGGAIANNDGNLTISDSLFEGNVARRGGAVDNDSPLEITGTVFRDNEAETGSEGGGGAIHDGDDLSVSGSLFEGNTTGNDGGAISVFSGGVVDVDGTTFRNNVAGGDGGAVHSFGDLTVENSTFEGNSAPEAESYGGAIENNGGQVDLRTSTLVGNDAHEGGGLSSRSGTVEVTNVTISGNTADAGAGVYAGAEATMTLSHATVARNTATTQGGGVHNPDFEVQVGHTLIAENAPENCSGSGLGSLGHNVTDDDSCTLSGDPAPDDETDVDDAGLSDLGDHGGATETHALLVGSPAIDVFEDGATEDETCEDAQGAGLSEDQRGAPRPLDGDDSGVAFCDAGAFEFAPPDSLQLAPADATNETDTEHTVTATVTDTLGVPVESISVRFSVTGANSGSGSDVTDANGEASFTYTGDNAGDDTITAFADTNGNATDDDAEPSDTAAKSWEEPPEEPPAEPEQQTIRLRGDDRWATAIDVSQDRFPANGTRDTVVLARGDDPNGYADALAGAPLAVCKRAPLLITQPDELRPEVADEIQRLLGDSGNVILLGLTAALDESVERAVANLGYSTERIGGADRIATSIEVADTIEGDCYSPDNVLIARALDFADGLAGAASAPGNDGVVLLNRQDVRDDRVEAYIDDHGEATVHALGGQMAALYPQAQPLFGETRIETAVAIADEFFTDPTVVGVARARKFPDPLTGGAHIGARGGPMLLTHDAETAADTGETVAPAAQSYLCGEAGSLTTAYVYGGTLAISAATEDAVDARIRGEGC